MNVELKDISINQYCNLLREGVDVELLNEIDKELTKAIGSAANGFDLALFMLQKDLLVFQCKMAKAYFEFDSSKNDIYNNKITELQEQIAKKTVKKERGNPYQSFLAWILAVEKYLSFAIDKNNDLLYFSEATKQMINHYEAQKAQLEKK